MEKLTIKVNEQINLKDFLLANNFSRGKIENMLKKKDIKINGNRIKNDCSLQVGDEVCLFYKAETINIVFEDDNIIIVSKPFGIEVEGENGLAKKLNALAVHRLDRNTTGLIIFAKDKTSQNLLENAIREKKIIKKYYAEVVGKADYTNYTFNAFLVKDAEKSKVKIYTKNVQNAEKISTTFNTIKSSDVSSLIECTLHTGKTHQIRASLAYLNHPIIGDGKYGKNEDNKRFKEKKQRLHSFYLKLNGLKEKLSYLNGKEFYDKPDWVK